MGLVLRYPEPGERVGDYRIVEKLGSGGFGTTFKAERAGLFFTVKMLRASGLGARAWREISIHQHLEHPGVARFRGCDRWGPEPGIPYIVVDFVPGPTLEEFVRVHNPSAREAARFLLETARILGEVHQQGVFHRDLKPENIIISGEQRRPVLIDFGVGWYAGAPLITPFGMPPGTAEFRSPEVHRFNRANKELHPYEFGASDELWALGVTFYWLLTDVLPFGDRNDSEGGGLTERILNHRPQAPHELNPRVPRALSDLCMKMLEKKPEERHAGVVELCAAVSGAMDGAEADVGWDEPLLDPDAHQRGRQPEREEESGPADPKEADALPPQEEAPQAPAPAEAPEATTASLPSVAHRRLGLIAAAAGLAVGVLGASLLMVLLLRSGPAPLITSSEAPPTWRAGPGREMAGAASPLESQVGGGAEPGLGSLSAPVMMMMPDKNDSNQKPQQEKTKVLGRAGKALGTLLICKTLTGCPAPQVRPTPNPEPAECPAGAVKTMKALGIEVDPEIRKSAYFFPSPRGGYVTVREGENTFELPFAWGKLPENTLLSGRLIFGDGRLYGRLTEARTPSGEKYKVCFEVWDIEGGRGVRRESDEGSGDLASARIISTVYVKAVSRFK